MQTFTPEQAAHDILVTGNHDERMRQDFCMALRQVVQEDLLSGLDPIFRGRVTKKYVAEHGSSPEDRRAIRDGMIKDPYFQAYATANRVSMELLWEAIISPLERDAKEINSKAQALSNSSNSILETNKDFDVPRYVSAIDIHCMPGGYSYNQDENDVSAGALYDRGVYIFAMGRMGADNDDMGRSVCNYVQRNLPQLNPTNILDLGCTVGHSTLPYKKSFPDAAVTGIDVAGPCVRYAHARAASKGYDVSFMQRNAENTEFEDNSFDLIVSHILLHETSGKAMPAIFNECYRLLKPGGIMIHADLPAFDKMGPFMQFMLDNETHYSNEPFWSSMREINQEELAIKAGFKPDDIYIDNAPMAGLEDLAKLTGESLEREFVAGEFAPGGGWEVLIAKKV